MIKFTLEAARVNAGLTQGEAAKELGIHIATLVNYEKGRTSPKHTVAMKMVELYGIPLDMLNFSRVSSVKPSKEE